MGTELYMVYIGSGKHSPARFTVATVTVMKNCFQLVYSFTHLTNQFRWNV